MLDESSSCLILLNAFTQSIKLQLKPVTNQMLVKRGTWGVKKMENRKGTKKNKNENDRKNKEKI